MQTIAANTWSQRVRARIRSWFVLFNHTTSSSSEASASNPVVASRLSAGTGGVAPAMVPNGKKVLVVDDNAVIIKTLSLKLKAAGYEVFSAEDGGTAVSTARKEKPDLILLDISFPPDVAHGGGVAWDGFLIIDWLRRLEEAKDIPIIVISGGDPAKYKQRALAKGAQSFFHKPIHNEELLAAIDQALAAKAPKTVLQTA